ncbi:MAG: 2-oxo acid dehydrogenase subunit E2 [Alicyclobacillaceae bacterium]|nr:2-oxo acid dehydrogenase subunit E2 [Alicyclobacillaceae bacterium]
MGVYEFRLPELGEGLHEGRIERWLVKPGDTVQEDDAIAEVENDKALVELPSPVSGRVLEIKVPAGQTAVVGDVLITFEVEGSGNAAPTAGGPAADVRTAAVEQAGLETVTDTVAARHLDTPAASTATAPAPPDSPTPVRQEVLATPGVRKYAREQGVDLSRVTGTGPNGKITKTDVDNYLQQQAPDPAPAAADAEPALARAANAAGKEGAEERVPLTAIRKRIAEAMVQSMYTAPHVTLMDEANVTELVQWREELKPTAAVRGVKLTYLPFVVKALVAALKQHPVLNASLDSERQELVLKRYYHVGIATDTERGLMVPVVRDADAKNMWTIAAEIDDLATRARAGKLSPNELKGSTISITNIGSAGGLFFTPIINYPEVAILGVGRITERPVIQNGQVVGAQIMALSLSFDHRIIDGAIAQRCMNDIKRLLENPRLLLMEV